MLDLHKLSKNCDFEQYHEEFARDAFINDVASPIIRQRQFENCTLNMQKSQNEKKLLLLKLMRGSASSVECHLVWINGVAIF